MNLLIAGAMLFLGSFSSAEMDLPSSAQAFDLPSGSVLVIADDWTCRHYSSRVSVISDDPGSHYSGDFSEVLEGVNEFRAAVSAKCPTVKTVWFHALDDNGVPLYSGNITQSKEWKLDRVTANIDTGLDADVLGGGVDIISQIAYNDRRLASRRWFFSFIAMCFTALFVRMFLMNRRS